MSGEKMIERYLEMDYPVIVARDSESKQFFAEVPDWPGCRAHGASIEEAFRKLGDAKYSWVEDCLERGIAIPLPRPKEDHSGKFLLRLARSLHRRLSQLAETEGVSLNTYVATVLSEHVGASKGSAAIKSLHDDIMAMLEQLKEQAENRTTSVSTEEPWEVAERFLKSTTMKRPHGLRQRRELFSLDIVPFAHKMEWK
jgi:antitoxin HicB